MACLLFEGREETYMRDCSLHYAHELCYTLNTLDVFEVIHGFS